MKQMENQFTEWKHRSKRGLNKFQLKNMDNGKEVKIFKMSFVEIEKSVDKGKYGDRKRKK